MKRYFTDGRPLQDPEGYWCKWEDVKQKIEQIKEGVELYLAHKTNPKLAVIRRMEKYLGHPIINEGYYKYVIEEELEDAIRKHLEI